MNLPNNQIPAETLSLAEAEKLGRIAAIWGVTGFTLLLGEALYKVMPWVIDLFSHPLSLMHWLILIAWCAFMGYTEGYKGFQKHYSPRFAARLRWLSQNPSRRRAALAPLFCMCFIGTTRKRKIVAYTLTAFIFLLVVFIRMLPQPWRGIIDVGVI
ncbi:MAG: hypothetical protein ACAI44_31870, partial [Candidatus Sericytochromatia bacterium]